MPLTESAIRARQVLLELIQDPDYLEHYRCHGLTQVDDRGHLTKVCPIGALAAAVGVDLLEYDRAIESARVHLDPYHVVTEMLNAGLPDGPDDYAPNRIDSYIIYLRNDSDRLDDLAAIIQLRTPELKGA